MRSRRSGLLFLLLFMFSITVGSAFIHSHTLPNGQIIVHSHLFPWNEDETPAQPVHQHKPQSLLFYHLFSLDYDFNDPETEFASLYPPSVVLLELPARVCFSTDIRGTPPQRAPPK